MSSKKLQSFLAFLPLYILLFACSSTSDRQVQVGSSKIPDRKIASPDEEWEIIKSDFIISNMLDPNKYRTTRLADGIQGIDNNNAVMLKEGAIGKSDLEKAIGKIYIIKMNQNLETKTYSIPASVRILSKGVYVKGSNSGSRFTLHGLKGKQIKDIFGKYDGFDAGIGIAFLDLSLRIWKNPSGVWIGRDQIFGWSAGLKVTHTVVEVSSDGFADSEVSVLTAGANNGGIINTKVKMSEVLNESL